MSKATRIKNVRETTRSTFTSLAVPGAIIVLLVGAVSLASGNPTPLLAAVAAFAICTIIILDLQAMTIERIKNDPLP